MKKEKNVEVKEETSQVIEKPKKKGKIVKLIIFAIILIALGVAAIIVIPKIKDEGIEGVLDPSNLTKEEKKYYDLYVKAIDKYKNLKSDDNDSYEYGIIYLEEVEEPILILSHNSNKKYVRKPREDVTLFYIKDGKVIEKKYGENSNIKPYYNIELDKIDYYLYQVEDAQSYDQKFKVTLLKDIVTECSDPYTVTLDEDDCFLAVSNKGVKTHIQKIYYVFIEYLETTFDSEKSDLHRIYTVNGYKYIKHQLKKAINNKYYLKDLINDRTWEKVDEKLSEYNLKRGQKILDNSEVTGGSCKVNTSSPQPTETTPSPEVKETIPDTKISDPEKTVPEPSKPAKKCNDGFVYVSDDKMCYNSKKTKDPVTPSCQSDYTKFGPDCGKVVDSSLCESGNDQYAIMEGKCVDNSTVYNNFPQCPSGYQYLWGSYGGQEFNGDCYKYEKPNY